MSKMISGDTLKTIAQGALGAMTFGAYHQFNTNKMMELNNEMIKSEHKREMDKMELNNKYLIDKMEIQHNKEMHELNEKVERLLKNQSNKNWW